MKLSFEDTYRDPVSLLVAVVVCVLLWVSVGPNIYVLVPNQ